MNWILLLFLFVALALFFVRDKMKFPGKGSVPGVILYGIFGGLILLSLSRSVREGYANATPSDFIFESKILESAAIPGNTNINRYLTVPEWELFKASDSDPSKNYLEFSNDEKQRCLGMKGVETKIYKYNSNTQRSQLVSFCVKDCESNENRIYGRDGRYAGCGTIPQSRFTEDQREKCLSQNAEIIEKISSYPDKNAGNMVVNYPNGTWDVVPAYSQRKIQDMCVEKCPEGTVRIEGGKCKAVNTVPKDQDGKCPDGFSEASFKNDLCVAETFIAREIKETVRGAPGPDGELMCPDKSWEPNPKDGSCIKFAECPSGFGISYNNPFTCVFTGNMSSVEVLDRVLADKEALAMDPANTSNVACPAGYILDPTSAGNYCIKTA